MIIRTTFFETFSGMSSSLSKVVTSAESGNVGGILAGVTGIFTSPIKAFAKAHDAKLDRQIKLAERQLNELKNLSSNISSVIEKTLGGIYSYERSSDTTKKLNDVKNDYKAWEVYYFSSICFGILLFIPFVLALNAAFTESRARSKGALAKIALGGGGI